MDGAMYCFQYGNDDFHLGDPTHEHITLFGGEWLSTAGVDYLVELCPTVDRALAYSVFRT